MPQSAEQFSGIFICYRRDDSTGHAGRLYDRLTAHFGSEQIFMDMDQIEPGEDFVQVIEEAVGSCQVLLAVMGRNWLTSSDEEGRRLDNPNDFVRLEIAAALARDVRIIPVLLQGARMPRPQDLPEDLLPLARRQAFDLSDQRWRQDVDRLVGTLEKTLAVRQEARLKAEEVARLLREEDERLRTEASARAEAAETARRAREAAEAETRRPEVEEDESSRDDVQPPARSEGVARRPAAEITHPPPDWLLHFWSQLAQKVDLMHYAVRRWLRWFRRRTAALWRGRPRSTAEGLALLRQNVGPVIAVAGVFLVFLFLVISESRRIGQAAQPTAEGQEAQAQPIPDNTPAPQAPGEVVGQPPHAEVRRAPQTVKNSVGMEFVLIPAGEFMMGSTEEETRAVVERFRQYVKNMPASHWDDERPKHRVVLGEPFYLGKYEVTQGQWRAVMGTDIRRQRDKAGRGLEVPGEGDNFPMGYVSWDDAASFIRKLNQLNDGYEYRLPSEAEWEYAARGGTTGEYPGDLDSLAWFADNSGRDRLNTLAVLGEVRRDPLKYDKRLDANGNTAHEVGSKEPNGFGLYDMLGSVSEWCQDWYHPSYEGAPEDGRAWVEGSKKQYRVARGGSWYNNADSCRPAARRKGSVGALFGDRGLRVVAVARR
jgi:formylglycine-generating enzyme required for sulfatase activity